MTLVCIGPFSGIAANGWPTEATGEVGPITWRHAGDLLATSPILIPPLRQMPRAI